MAEAATNYIGGCAVPLAEKMAAPVEVSVPTVVNSILLVAVIALKMVSY